MPWSFASSGDWIVTSIGSNGWKIESGAAEGLGVFYAVKLLHVHSAGVASVAAIPEQP